MQRRIALKRLKASDLTLFEWQFRHRNAGNQKSINLNADVFVKQLFPSLPEVAAETNGRIPLDLSIYGPGNSGFTIYRGKLLRAAPTRIGGLTANISQTRRTNRSGMTFCCQAI